MTGDYLARVSRDGGATWTDSEVFPLLRAVGIASDMAGNIYVTGYGGEVNPGKYHWITLRLDAIPAISFKHTGNTLHLNWPSSATNFVLESATTLANGGDWQNSGPTPTLVGDQKVVNITPTGVSGFFRLRGP